MESLEGQIVSVDIKLMQGKAQFFRQISKRCLKEYLCTPLFLIKNHLVLRGEKDQKYLPSENLTNSTNTICTEILIAQWSVCLSVSSNTSVAMARLLLGPNHVMVKSSNSKYV